MMQRSIRALEDELKLKLIHFSTKDKSLQLGIVAAIMVLFLVNMKFKWISFYPSFYLALAVMMTLAIISVYRAYRKLKIEGFPDWYLKDMVKSNLLRSIGLTLFLITLAFV
jgi:hypothetical protein